ncbi:unnamed protein product [Clonostachys byssicola]|uniref:Heterokaryon incompatibility domain-containing protein n=1 Tax=Clonostachys byssicola TaxID=160290 RepID=A0A9N9Y1T9_9HYPO|nr:unnamed protein product [Clonostachys byssicola]
MPSVGSRFTYEALTLGEFRLLSIRPGHAPCEYKYSLRHESLSNPPPYKALSYVWGDPTAHHEIKLNDGRFAINSNLKTALKYLRFEDEEAIWIDAICINQNDDQEKSRQIAAMSQIYRGANEVIAWIGESSQESRRAFAYLDTWLRSVTELMKIQQAPVDGRDIYDLNKRKDLIVSEFPLLKGDTVHQILKIIEEDMSMSLGSLNSPHILSIEIDIHFLSQPAESRILDLIRDDVNSRDDAETPEDEEAPHKVKLSNPNGPLAKLLASIDGDFHALRHTFSERAWWERLWVIQEAVVSRELSLQCGQEKIPWVCLDQTWHLVLRYFQQPIARTLTSVFHRMWEISLLRKLKFVESQEGSYYYGLDFALESFERFKSTDPRDKIFGLLNIVSSTGPAIQPDYGKKTSEVFTEAAVYLISQTRRLNVLCGTQRADSKPQWQEDDPLPSWVPNFSLTSGYEPLLRLNEGSGVYNASGESHIIDAVSYDDLSRSLYLTGFVWEEIDHATTRSRAEDLDWEATLLQWEPESLEAREYPTGENIVEVYWRTLLKDSSLLDPDNEHTHQLWTRLKHWTSSRRGPIRKRLKPDEMCDEICMLRSCFWVWSNRTLLREGVLELWRSPGISDQRYLNKSASYVLEGNKFRHVRQPGWRTTDDSSLGEELDITMSMSVAAEDINDRSESENNKALTQEREESDQETVTSEDYDILCEDCTPFTKDELLEEGGPFKMNYRDRLRHSTLGYMFFTTKKGYMGLVQGDASPGDLVAIVQGSDVPLILRRQASGLGRDGEERIFYTLVGASYVHGIMDGQVAEQCSLDEDKIYLQ